MVSVHKRKKASRIRGARTCGWGFRQKHKGHGNKGGVGMAGTGKRTLSTGDAAQTNRPDGLSTNPANKNCPIFA